MPITVELVSIERQGVPLRLRYCLTGRVLPLDKFGLELADNTLGVAVAVIIYPFSNQEEILGLGDRDASANPLRIELRRTPRKNPPRASPSALKPIFCSRLVCRWRERRAEPGSIVPRRAAESTSPGVFPRLAQEPPRPVPQTAIGGPVRRHPLDAVQIPGDLANGLAGGIPVKRDSKIANPASRHLVPCQRSIPSDPLSTRHDTRPARARSRKPPLGPRLRPPAPLRPVILRRLPR